MSSPTTGQGTTCERGNVARIVDRLSKQDFITLTRAENAPLKASRGGVSGVSAVGVCALPMTEGVSSSDADGGVVFSDDNDGPKEKECAVVRFSYAAQQPDELDLKEGDELAVLELVEDGWARGCILHSATNPNAKGRSGLYPTNFVSTLSPTPTTQTAPAIALPSSSVPLHSKIEDKQPAEHTQPSNISVPPIPTSTSDAKPSSVLYPFLANGSGVVQASNVLPSTLLKGGAPSTVAAGARRAVSTLIVPTAAAALLESADVSNAHKTKEFAKVLYNYEAANPDELSLAEGTVVTVLSRHCEEEDWFIAEHEGRRGLFPDNFVRFLEHGHTQVSPNAQPPSLPAKPSKFGGIANPPLVSAPLNATVPSVNSRNSVITLTKSSAEDVKATTTEMHQSMIVDRTSQPTMPKPLLNNSAFDAQKTNASLSNRCSVIEGLQKQLFPNGKLPPQRPPQPNLAGNRQIGTDIEATAEPKMLRDEETPAKLLVSTSSIVKSRTNIAPSNKRPPSKVNSAATLVDSVNCSTTFDQQNNFPLASVVRKPIQTQAQAQQLSLAEEMATANAFAGGSSANIAASSAAVTNKTTIFSTRPSSPPLQPTLYLCTVSDEQQPAFSSSPTSVVGKQCRAPQHSPLLPSAPSSDESNVISRIEFDRYKEEQERKVTALQTELKELRCKLMELAPQHHQK